ncbi:MAG TPA: hypothetical protein VLG49_06415 [Rhabdochlamydiaceae bacterium]|nr:hypothetical protein [Rhabdochlamydiaceae bacterium]
MKKMKNKKRIIGIVVLIIGIVLIVFACYERHRVANAKSAIHSGTGFMPENAVSKMVGGSLEKKASSYDAPLMGILIAGIILLIVGAWVSILSCRKRS